MELVELAKAKEMRMVPGDELVWERIGEFLGRPFVFLSCSLSQAPMDFVSDMLGFQRELAAVCRTHEWSVDVTARPDTNESAEISAAIFAHDTAGVRSADAVVAEVSYPSTGSGIELGIACELNTPILLVARSGSRVSPFVRGMPNAIYREYDHPNELIELVRTHLLPRIRRP
jgi:hypothetical protein